jgi:hypothetical protein
MKLTVTEDTFLKAFPLQSAELKNNGVPDQLVPVPKGAELDIVDHLLFEGESPAPVDDHYFVQLTEPLQGHQEARWFIYSLHVQIEGVETENDPKDEPDPEPEPKPADTGPKISLPGISRQVGIYEPVYWGSNFTWAELTKGGQRIPVDSRITERIVGLCKYMDEVRSYLGNRPITVTSGYRDPKTNRRIGGARSSRHMAGDAMDFFVQGENVVTTFNRLKSYHTRGGLAVGNGFVHIDRRPGGPVRWTYPGGPKVSLW